MSLDKQRQEIRDLEEKLAEKRRALQTSEQNCPHEWSEPKYDPIIREAMTIPGDPPGTGGIDHRGPYHIPSSRVERWTRTCQRCGKVESTTTVDQRITKTPKFGN